MTIARPRRVSAGVKDGCAKALGFADDAEGIARDYLCSYFAWQESIERSEPRTAEPVISEKGIAKILKRRAFAIPIPPESLARHDASASKRTGFPIVVRRSFIELCSTFTTLQDSSLIRPR